jgi:cell division protein FtsB
MQTMRITKPRHRKETGLMPAVASISFVFAETLIQLSTAIIACVIAFAVGALLAFLLVTPAKVAADRRVHGQVRSERSRESHIDDLRKQNDQLHENNTSLVAERDHLRAQLDALRQHDASAIAASAPSPDSNPASPAVQSQAAHVAPAADTSHVPVYTTPAEDMSHEPAHATPAEDMSHEPAHAAPADEARPQESVGERIKDFFTGNRESQVQRESQDQTASRNAQEPNVPA